MDDFKHSRIGKIHPSFSDSADALQKQYSVLMHRFWLQSRLERHVCVCGKCIMMFLGGKYYALNSFAAFCSWWDQKCLNVIGFYKKKHRTKRHLLKERYHNQAFQSKKNSKRKFVRFWMVKQYINSRYTDKINKLWIGCELLNTSIVNVMNYTWGYFYLCELHTPLQIAETLVD